jgi:hypothetical protein
MGVLCVSTIVELPTFQSGQALSGFFFDIYSKHYHSQLIVDFDIVAKTMVQKPINLEEVALL